MWLVPVRLLTWGQVAPPPWLRGAERSSGQLTQGVGTCSVSPTWMRVR